MNDLKTAERNSLGQENLRNLMKWHTSGKDLKCEEVPVMQILKEFRALGGVRGRNTHRPHPPATYNHSVKHSAQPIHTRRGGCCSVLRTACVQRCALGQRVRVGPAVTNGVR